MKILIQSLILILIVSNQLSSQVCDTLRGYNFGANYNSLMPFAVNSSLNIADYALMYSDLVRDGDNYSISSTARFLNMTSFNQNYLKLHINDHFNHTYRDVKYEFKFFNRIFSNTPLGSGQFYLSGKIQPIPLATGSLAGTSSGLIKYTDNNGGINTDILTHSGITIGNDDVILKTIEDASFIYACGYSITSFGGGVTPPMRVGILYIIDKSVLSTNGTYLGKIPNPQIRLYQINTVITDILLDGTDIYISGANEGNPTRGFIAKLDPITDTYQETLITTTPVFPPAIGNAAVMVNSIIRGNLPGEFYGLFRHAAPANSRINLFKFDANVDSVYSYAFNIDFGPGRFGRWRDAFPTNLEIDPSDNIFIGGYVKDDLCTILPTAANCFYRHINFMFKEPTTYIPPPGINPMKIFGYKDFGYTNLDLDPFSQSSGSGINSSSRVNKIPRTIALNPSQDSLHIAYQHAQTLTNKTIISHYQRGTNDYLIRQPDACILCQRDTLTADIITPTVTFVNQGSALLSTLQIIDCDIVVENGTTSKWHEEYPRKCDSLVIDGNTGCNYWGKIIVFSGSDTLCKNSVDTLYMTQPFPFGITSYSWVRMSNTSNVLGTDYKLPINKGGVYRLSCGKTLSDGTVCYETFFKTIHDPLPASIQTPTTKLCPGDKLTLYGFPVISPNTYTYSWSNGINTPDIDITTPGTYSVTVTFDNGCIDEASITITQGSPSLTQTVSKQNGHTVGEAFTASYQLCNETNTNYTSKKITVTIPEGYDLGSPVGLWSTITTSPLVVEHPVAIGPGTASSPTCSTLIILPLVATNPCKGELKAITDAYTSPCTGADTSTMLNSARDIVSAAIDVSPSTPLVCKQMPITLTANSGAATSNLTYQWAKASPTSASLGTSKTEIITNNDASVNSESYKVTITQDGQCTQIAPDKVVDYYTEPLLSFDAEAFGICQPNTTGKVMITSLASGGKAFLTPQAPQNHPSVLYQYYIGTVANKLNPDNKLQDDVSIGKKNVSIEDANGCKLSKDLEFRTITIGSVTSSTGIIPTCNPLNLGSINVIFTPHSSQKTPYRYLYSDNINATVDQSSSLTTNTALNLSAGVYSISVQDRNYCEIKLNHDLNYNPKPVVSFKQIANCNGTSVTIEPLINQPLNYTYAWRKKGNTDVVFTTKNIWTSLNNQDWILTLTDLLGLCSYSYEVQSKFNSTPILWNTPLVDGQTYFVQNYHQLADNTNLKNCTFYLSNSINQIGRLSVSNIGSVTLYNCTIDVCDNQLSGGILVASGGSLTMESSSISNMFKAIEFIGNANLQLKNNQFKDNVIGIQFSQTGAYTLNANHSISGNTFIGNTANGLKPKHSLMSYGTHDLMPSMSSLYSNSLAGIVNYGNSSLNIGNSAEAVNTFENLLFGVMSSNGFIEIKNSKFSNIESKSSSIYSFSTNAVETGTAVLGYNSTTNQSTLNVLGLYSIYNIENAKNGISISGMNCNIVLNAMNNVINGVSYNKNSNLVQSGITSLTISNNYIQNSSGNAIYLKDNNPVNNRLEFTINQNVIHPTTVSTMSNQSLIKLESDVLMTSAIVPFSRIFSNNIIHNSSHKIGFEASNFHGLSSSSNNKLFMNASTSNPQIAGFYYNNCKFITETGNVVKGGSSTYNGTNYLGLFSGMVVTPIGFIYNNVSGTISNPSTFSCNEISNNVNSGALMMGDCSNSYLTKINFAAKNFGILIPNNSIISSHIAKGNKFYCGKNSNYHIYSELIPPAVMSSTIFFAGFNSVASILTGCAPWSSGICLNLSTNGFVYNPISNIFPTNVIVKSSNISHQDPSYSQSCPICIPIPMAAPPQPELMPKVPTCDLSPNPTHAITEVILDRPTSLEAKITVYDKSGKLLIEDLLLAGSLSYKLIAEKLISGTYIVLVRENDKIICNQKLIIEK